MTDAVIWRKRAAISAWISASVLSVPATRGLPPAGIPAGGAGAAFSWFVVAEEEEDLDLEGRARIWTWRRGRWKGQSARRVVSPRLGREGATYVELPALDVLARVLVGEDDDQIRDLAPHHPLVKLGHDLLDVGLDLVVGRHQHVEAILLDGREVLGRVDTSLESSRVRFRND